MDQDRDIGAAAMDAYMAATISREAFLALYELAKRQAVVEYLRDAGKAAEAREYIRRDPVPRWARNQLRAALADQSNAPAS